MKKSIFKILLSCLFSTVIFMSISVFADIDQDENPANYNIVDVLNKLKQDGFKTVNSIEFEDNTWKVEVKENAEIPPKTEAVGDTTVPSESQIQQTEKTYTVNPATLKCSLLKTETEDDSDPYPPESLEKLTAAIDLVSKQYKTIQSISYDDDLNCWEVKVIENNTVEKELKVDIDGTKILSTEIDD